MPDEPRASRTALITCLMRALHTRFDRPALIDDPWADQLVLPQERQALANAIGHSLNAEQRARLTDPDNPDVILHALWHATPVYGGVVVRTRYAEEQVQAAARKGVRQYLIIGAGLDSFAMRRPEFANDVHVFEVDHPASQESKRERLACSGAALPPTLHFVPADLSKEELTHALRRSAFRLDEPAILSWLGVTMYLPRDANLATLRSVGQLAPGSELVFTYIEQRALDSRFPAMQRARAVAAAMGEPWICGFDSATLPDQLYELGLSMVEDLGFHELQERYCTSRTDGLTVGKASRIARVRVN